jgi:hypothetical protein
MKITIPKLPIFFQFIIFISFIEVLFFFLLKNSSLGIFKLVPYLRLISIFFVGVFLFKKKLINNSFFRISKINIVENKLMLCWLLFSIICFIIGVLNRNPLLYLFTDFMYICIGFFLFRTFQVTFEESKINNKLSSKQNIYFLIYSLFILLTAFFIKSVLPSFFLLFLISYSLYMYFEKKYVLSFLFLTPFFFQILTANRSVLVVFLIVLIIAMVRGRFSRKNVFILFSFLVLFFFFSYFFLENILKYVLENLESSSLKQRLTQVYLIVSGKINWNSPMALSLKQRFVEAEVVIDYWMSNPIRFIFGGGLGATIDGFAFKDHGVTSSAILGKQAIHNIHLLPFSLILRYGFFGILLFLLLIIIIFKYLDKIIFNEIDSKFPMYVFILTWIIYSMPAASFLWTCSFFWIILGQISKNE